MKKYPYLILFLLTFTLALPAMWGELFTDRFVSSASGTSKSQGTDSQAGSSSSKGDGADFQAGSSSSEENDTHSAGSAADNTADGGSITDGSPDNGAAPPEFITVDRSYWDDALFIGDSRMLGLAEYTDLGGAHIFASQGMSTFKLFTAKNSCSVTPVESLQELLEQNTYGKIYIMLGINEIGYEAERLEKQYRFVIDTIHSLQPDALFFLCGNLHVTAERSERDELYNNDNINRLNASIEALAIEYGFCYLDVNEIFDDESGSLSAELTNDDIHIKAKYYEDWAEWLCTKGISTTEEKEN